MSGTELFATFLGSVAREGGKLFVAEERRQIKSIEERVGVLARIAWEALRGGKGRKTSPGSAPTTPEGGTA